MKRLALLALLLLAACGDPPKAEILRKAEAVQTKAELRAVLGDPDGVEKLGPIETWTYRASDGSVVFLLAGDRVTVQATGN